MWLARLSDELLDLVDAKKIGISQGVDISFLTGEQQRYVLEILLETGASVSSAQAAKLKEYGKSGELTLAMVRLILTEEKPKERKVTIKGDKISRYFPEEYSNDEIEDVIIRQEMVASLAERAEAVRNRLLKRRPASEKPLKHGSRRRSSGRHSSSSVTCQRPKWTVHLMCMRT